MANTRRVLPGFGLSLGYTLVYLSILVLIPFSGLLLKTFTGGWEHFFKTITEPRVLASYSVSFGISLAAALVNGVFGVMAAWVLARYEFPGRKILDAIVDLPFALPTAVAGIALTAIYAKKWRNRLAARALWDQSRLHPARYFRGADLHWPPVRRAHRATGHPGSLGGRRGSCGDARRES
ncbi:MAG: hypothetical protein WBW78_03245, partial [Terrimicrobiaceae bacterium]